MPNATVKKRETTGPFRADHVGSFLRTERLKQARADWKAGTLSKQGLREVENEEIQMIVEKQKQAGHLAITDGEFRRTWWHHDFNEKLVGVESYEAEKGYQFAGGETKAWMIRIVDKIDFPNDHPFVDDFRFLKEVVGEGYVAKQTIPSPSMLFLEDPLAHGAYDNEAEFRKDLTAAYKKAIQVFYEAGCRYLQFDDVAWAVLIPTENDDEKTIAWKKQKQLWQRDIINEAIADKPEDLVITMHICRGNFRSSYSMSGAYDPVAEVVLGELNIDGFFLEYDDERSGSFEALQYLKRTDATVVLGIITSKTGKLEEKEALKARIAQASAYVPLEQLAISPQCGFASTEEGNILTEEEQWEKLRFVKEVAEDVWQDR